MHEADPGHRVGRARAAARPLRLAEDIAALDLASNGRITVIGGLGYRPEEYEAHGRSWSRRGALMDESIEAMLAAWSGEPFTYQGRRARVTPTPERAPQQLLFIGGRTRAAARRAARFGLPFNPVAELPELAAIYEEACRADGTEGLVIMPPSSTAFTFVAEDPDEAWASLGGHFLHEARQYAGWQTDAVHSAAYSPASTVDELRAEGEYRVLSPEPCIAVGQEGEHVFVLTPSAEGWRRRGLGVPAPVRRAGAARTRRLSGGVSPRPGGSRPRRWSRGARPTCLSHDRTGGSVFPAPWLPPAPRIGRAQLPGR